MDFKHKYTGSLPIAVSPHTEFAPKNGITISPRIRQKQIAEFGNSEVLLKVGSYCMISAISFKIVQFQIGRDFLSTSSSVLLEITFFSSPPSSNPP